MELSSYAVNCNIPVWTTLADWRGETELCLCRKDGFLCMCRRKSFHLFPQVWLWQTTQYILPTPTMGALCHRPGCKLADLLLFTQKICPSAWYLPRQGLCICLIPRDPNTWAPNPKHWEAWMCQPELESYAIFRPTHIARDKDCIGFAPMKFPATFALWLTVQLRKPYLIRFCKCKGLRKRMF